MTRTSQTRNSQRRVNQYTPKGELDLSDSIIKHFHQQGLKLRWVRFAIGNQTDERNLARYKAEGWNFVSKSQLPEDDRDFFSTTKIGTNNSVICQGDLVLATIDAEISDSRQEYYESMSEAAVESTRREAQNTEGNSRMNKLVPIIDETEDPELTVGQLKKT